MTQASSISEFCKNHSISRALFYKALKEGWGPKLMACGRRRLISDESATAWRREMERNSNAGRS